MSFISNLFSWISDLFESIWGFIKRALPYILMAIATYFSFGALAPVFMAGTLAAEVGWAGAALALGASYLLAPDETVSVVNGGIDAVGDSLSELGQVAGSVASDTLGSFFSSGFGLWAIIGVGAYLILTRGNDDEERPTSSQPLLKRPAPTTPTQTAVRASSLPPSQSAGGPSNGYSSR